MERGRWWWWWCYWAFYAQIADENIFSMLMAYIDRQWKPFFFSAGFANTFFSSKWILFSFFFHQTFWLLFFSSFLLNLLTFIKQSQMLNLKKRKKTINLFTWCNHASTKYYSFWAHRANETKWNATPLRQTFWCLCRCLVKL